jgi:adenosylcobyric acid synthase
LPYIHDLRIPQEDGAILDGRHLRASGTREVAAGVVRLPRISNYTDFAPFEDEPDVALHYLTDPAAAPELDLLMIPGTKNTIADLAWLRQAGWENYLARHLRRGGWLVGICGGYQMLGRRVLDPGGVESKVAEVTGLGFLDVETCFEPGKITERIKAVDASTGAPIVGYEIHAGRLVRAHGAAAPFRIIEREGARVDEIEGAQSEDGRVLGTSIHGLFDGAGFRRGFLDRIRAAKGLGPRPNHAGQDFKAVRERAYDLMADAAARHLDLRRLLALAGIT